MTTKLRFDFPPEVVRERTAIYERVMALLAEQTYEAVREANRLHLGWLRKYPNDAIALDAGEIVSMSLSAYEFIEAEKRAETADKKPVVTK